MNGGPRESRRLRESYTFRFPTMTGAKTHKLNPALIIYEQIRDVKFGGSLAFRGPYIVSIFQYISNKKMQSYTVYLYLGTALHVLGGKSTHQQEHTQLYLQHLVPVKP